MTGCYRCGKSRRGRRCLLCRQCEQWLDAYCARKLAGLEVTL